MSKKYYAVANGRKKGVLKSWDECKESVSGFPNAVYKGFDSLSEANDFLDKNAKDATASDNQKIKLPKNYAFVDGSFNLKTKVYGYGGFLVYSGGKEIITGSGSDSELASMRNVAGEISGCVAAVKKAVSLGLKEITIFYDYTGIEYWATDVWKAEKKGTKQYKAFFNEIKNEIKVNFRKVKGHSGIPGNEEADRLAKLAAGVSK